MVTANVCTSRSIFTVCVCVCVGVCVGVGVASRIGYILDALFKQILT